MSKLTELNNLAEQAKILCRMVEEKAPPAMFGPAIVALQDAIEVFVGETKNVKDTDYEEAYEEGYDTGYSEGYDDGLEDGKVEATSEIN